MSFASRSAHALKTASRRAPRAAWKPQAASYSLLAARTAIPAVSQRTTIQATRGIKTLDFAGTKEVVYERSDWPLPKLQDYFKHDTLALIGYGSQGHGQGLNARDNGMNVIVGVRKDGESWQQAIEDGWVCFISTSIESSFSCLCRFLAKPCSPSRKPSTRAQSL